MVLSRVRVASESDAFSGIVAFSGGSSCSSYKSSQVKSGLV